MRKIFFPFLVLLFLINACATYVDVKVLKPATVDIGDLKNLAVSDFEFVGSWTFDEKEPETIIEIVGKDCSPLKIFNRCNPTVKYIVNREYKHTLPHKK